MPFYLPATFSDEIMEKAQKIEVRCFGYSFLPNKIELIDSFLSMEGEKMSRNQLQKILNHKPTRLSSEIVKETQNTIQLCSRLNHFDPLSLSDFKKVHALFMAGFQEKGGRFRNQEVVVLAEREIVHIPPKSVQVPHMMDALFTYLKTRSDLSWILRACVFHYGVQYIHPFANGNGRIGRVWQHLLLLKASTVFNQILIGRIIKTQARAYYLALDKSDKEKNGTFFVEFCLRKIEEEFKKMAMPKVRGRKCSRES